MKEALKVAKVAVSASEDRSSAILKRLQKLEAASGGGGGGSSGGGGAIGGGVGALWGRGNGCGSIACSLGPLARDTGAVSGTWSRFTLICNCSRAS